MTNFWDEIRRIQQVVIHYPWKDYGVEPLEAYDAWRACLEAARREQLQALGVTSLAFWMLDRTKDYNVAMQRRLEDAKHRYLDKCVRMKLPQEAYQEFRTKIENRVVVSLES